MTFRLETDAIDEFRQLYTLFRRLAQSVRKGEDVKEPAKKDESKQDSASR